MNSISSEGFTDTCFGYRTHSIRTAAMCRLCLRQHYLVDIRSNKQLMGQLVECFPNLLHDDPDQPSFVCGECYQLIGITYQFTLRSTRTQVLLRTYVTKGGEFPRPEMLEHEYRRPEKRRAAADKEEDATRATKKRRSSEDAPKADRKERKPSNQPKKTQRTTTSTKPEEKERATTTKAKPEENKPTATKPKKPIIGEDYYRSDIFLFGEEIDFEDAKKCDVTDTKKKDFQTEEIVSSLPNISLKMSYEEMKSVLNNLQCIENRKKDNCY